MSGEIEWNESLFGYQLNDPEQDLSYSTLNNAAFMPKSVVVDDEFDWQGDQQLDPEAQRIKITPMLVMLNGHCLRFCDDEGQPVRDRGFLIFFNPFHTLQKFIMPEGIPQANWQVVVQTDPEQTFNTRDIRAGNPVRIKAHSILVLMN